MNLLPEVIERDGQPITTSRAVAECFGKQHFHVVRDIESIKEQLAASKLRALELANPKLDSLKNDGSEFFYANFMQETYIDAQGKARPYYIMTKDGFTLLAMGFTGAKALQFKIAYINAFIRMERLLAGNQLTASAEVLQSIERRLSALEQPRTVKPPRELQEIGTIFLEALNHAIDSGQYYIRFKGKPIKEKGDRELLGIRGLYTTAFVAKTAYKIYAEYDKNPLPRLKLWAILEQIGTIEPRDATPMKIKFDTNTSAVIYIQNQKIGGGV